MKCDVSFAGGYNKTDLVETLPAFNIELESDYDIMATIIYDSLHINVYSTNWIHMHWFWTRNLSENISPILNVSVVVLVGDKKVEAGKNQLFM